MSDRGLFQRTRRRSSTALAVVALLAVTTSGGVAVSAASAGSRTQSADSHPAVATPKPTVVLVHGAFADASGFSAEISRLEAAGYPVIAPADPLRGLTSDADYIRTVLASIRGPVILVGHSYGGAVITNAARGADNVVALVYLAAFVPDEGTSVATSYDPSTYPGSLLTPDALVVRPTINLAAPGGHDADLYIRRDRFRQVFAGDQSARTAAAMAAAQRPLSAFAFNEPSGAPAWRTIPSWDLITLDDRAISPGGQRFMAKRAGAHISTIHSAHDVMVSHPASVVRLVEHAAVRTR